MGKSTTPKYCVKVNCLGWLCTDAAWNVKGRCGQLTGNGNPTLANLDKYIEAFEGSMKPGGCNEHLGFSPVISAFIYRNDGSKTILVEWERSKMRKKEPMFQII